MDYIDWFPDRVAELRMRKGVSARDMSLSLGQSESYINKIENRRTLPSMTGFIYICEYLGITPRDFFDAEISSPTQVREISQMAKRLTDEQVELILRVMNEMVRSGSGQQ